VARKWCSSLNSLLDHAGWKKAWNQYCRLSGAPKAVVAKDMDLGTEGADGQYARGRLAAYRVHAHEEPGVRQEGLGGPAHGRLRHHQFQGPEVLNPIDEVPGVSTNSTAQGCLEAIEVLEMCGEQM